MRLWVWVLGQWVAVVWYLSCWFVQWDCVGFLEWVLTGFTMGGFRWGGFTVVDGVYDGVGFRW